MTYLPSKKSKRIDLTGQQFGRWNVRCYSHTDKQQAYWNVVCSCPEATIKIVGGNSLRNGRSQSCGCLKKDLLIKRETTHGLSKHKLYHTWYGMIDRCYNPDNKDYKDYGGRRIGVYYIWRFGKNSKSGIQLFIEYIEKHLGAKPSPNHSIDRIDNNRGYEPGNIKWSTQQEQIDNRRRYEWTDRHRTEQAARLKARMVGNRLVATNDARL